MNIKRLLIVLACFAAAPLFAQQTSIDDIRQLARDGQLDAALERIDQDLQSNPGDRQLRFLKGVILAEKNQTKAAIEVFRKLTVDYPELPEPYNNLAVLHAGQGDYEKARDALLLAINTHPSYATAHENLGDIYAKMAGVAYDKAFSIDTSNTTAKYKLDLIDDLFVSAVGGPISRVPARTVPAPDPVAEPASSTALAEPAPGPKPKPVSSGPPKTDSAAVLRVVEAWAADWAGQDVNAYLSHYAVRFKPVGGMSYSQWQQQRRKRLTRPTFIRIQLSTPVVHMQAADSAQVKFVQRYQSNTYKGTANKRLTLIKTRQGWKITREQVKG